MRDDIISPGPTSRAPADDTTLGRDASLLRLSRDGRRACKHRVAIGLLEDAAAMVPAGRLLFSSRRCWTSRAIH